MIQLMPNHQYNKTRIAPTPSGYLHLGNVLSFAITAALAQKHGAKILLRIDDIDRVRVHREYIQDIFDTLNFLNIPWDEGPRSVEEFEDSYSQQHRIPMYQEALTTLHDNKLVFACTCSRKQVHNADGTYNESACNCLDQHIPLSTENVNWRLITDNKEISVKDYSGKNINALLPDEMHNFVVKRREYSPAYQLTSIIDDLFYGIDLVVRGQDLWASTLAQHELAVSLDKKDFQHIAFYHHPLIMEAEGKKLSKSVGSTSIKYLRENGYGPAAIYTHIAAMLNIKALVSTWHELAAMIIGRSL